MCSAQWSGSSGEMIVRTAPLITLAIICQVARWVIVTESLRTECVGWSHSIDIVIVKKIRMISDNQMWSVLLCLVEVLHYDTMFCTMTLLSLCCFLFITSGCWKCRKSWRLRSLKDLYAVLCIFDSLWARSSVPLSHLTLQCENTVCTLYYFDQRRPHLSASHLRSKLLKDYLVYLKAGRMKSLS